MNIYNLNRQNICSAEPMWNRAKWGMKQKYLVANSLRHFWKPLWNNPHSLITIIRTISWETCKREGLIWNADDCELYNLRSKIQMTFFLLNIFNRFINPIPVRARLLWPQPPWTATLFPQGESYNHQNSWLCFCLCLNGSMKVIFGVCF